MKAIDRLRLPLTGRAVDVLVGHGALDAASEEVASRAKGRRVPFLVDARVFEFHRDRFEAVRRAAGVEWFDLALPEGEAAKSMAVVESACRRLVEAGVERDDFLIGAGGGAATDVVGFVAAVYLRGIDFMLAPTSLLAMVDAAIGGKSGVNLPEGKNLVGAFHQPFLVACDLALLATLPAREFRAGLAEIVKIAWIADPDLIFRLESHPDIDPGHEELHAVVRRAIELKIGIVAEDERESNTRRLLNFGHTWGHAIETEAGGSLLHGEAVALGLVAAVSHSVDLGRCPPVDRDRLIALLESLGLPTRRRELDPERVARRARFDKKRVGGAIRAVLTEGVGSASVADHVSEEALRRAVEFLRR